MPLCIGIGIGIGANVAAAGFGPELLVNGGFGSAANWTLVGTGSSISGGALNTGTAAFAGANQDVAGGTTTGQVYRLVVVVTALGTGVTPKLDFGPSWSPSLYLGAAVLNAGTNTFDVTIASGDANPRRVTLQNYTAGSVQAVIDSASLKLKL